MHECLSQRMLTELQPFVVQKPVASQQQRMPNGSYRGRGDTRRGRGRTEGPGRGYRGGRGSRGGPAMQYGPALDAVASNPMAAANHRSEDFGHNPARPQRMVNEDGPQGSGRGAPYGRSNPRGGSSYRGRGGRSTNAQKMQAVKPVAEAGKPGKSFAFEVWFPGVVFQQKAYSCRCDVLITLLLCCRPNSRPRPAIDQQRSSTSRPALAGTTNTASNSTKHCWQTAAKVEHAMHFRQLILG